MSRVVIYNSSWGTFGGGEKYICALADSISTLPKCDVTLLVDNPEITADQLRRFYGISLEMVSVENVCKGDVRSIMSSADLGIVTSNVKSLRTPARKNIYILQIPYYKVTAGSIATKIIVGNVKEGVKDVMRSFLLRDARSSDLVLVYSQFTKETLVRYHDHTPQFSLPG